MSLLAKILLRNLQFVDRGCLPKVCEQWRYWLADLEVDGSMLDLHYNVMVEFGIKTFEEIDGSIGTVGLPVTLVESQMVVYKGSEEDGSIVGSQSTGELAIEH